MSTASFVQPEDMPALLRKSGLFDGEFYRRKYPDVALSGIDPLRHYLDQGTYEDKDPNALFSSYYYRSQCPQLSELDISGLAHYILEGYAQNKDPSPLFDTSFYLGQCLDSLPAGMNALSHYINYGAWQPLDPHPLFNTEFYLRNYPDVIASGMIPLAHFVEIGAGHGYDPSPEFDTSFYIEQDPGLRETGANPLSHYIQYGRKEGRYTRNIFLDELPDSFPQDYELLRQIESLLPAIESLPDLILGRSLKTSCAGEAYFKLIHQMDKHFGHLFIMPDWRCASRDKRKQLNSMVDVYGAKAVLLLLTDSSVADCGGATDFSFAIHSLNDLGQKLTTADKVRILVRLVIQARPQFVYNCGSDVAREAFGHFRKQLEQCARLVEI